MIAVTPDTVRLSASETEALHALVDRPGVNSDDLVTAVRLARSGAAPIVALRIAHGLVTARQTGVIRG